MNQNDDQRLNTRIEKLEKKYDSMGQDIHSYLDGLLYSDYLTYWDYINLDVLLNLQQPKTPFPDENIFIIYHQITELYFKLILQELHLIADNNKPNADSLILRVSRINQYFKQLNSSFEIMVNGMDKKEFLKFRMALLPASGFQSAQFRMIELCSTDIINLVNYKERSNLVKSTDLKEIYEHLYWKSGATELSSGKKTLTLKQFEKKYSDKFIHLIKDFYHKNLRRRFKSISEEEQKRVDLLDVLREFDFSANVLWPLSHIKAAGRHLQKEEKVIAATGGTNWQKYLPPKNQRINFFPELWSDEEMEKWGIKSKL